MALIDEWLEKAEADFQAAVALNRLRKQPVPDVVCYECAQCAEKYLKAYLIAQGVTPPYTHDLVRLLNLCVPYAADFASRLMLVQVLNPYGVAIRYPALTATIAESKEAVRVMRRLRLFVRRKLGL